MPRIFLRSALRNLLRHKTQMLINVASLAIGLTVFGFAFIYVKEELSFDRGWPEAERIHRLTIEKRGLPGTREGTETGVSYQERERVLDYFGADIQASTRQVTTVAWLGNQGEQRLGMTLVDAEFLEIFQIEAVEGELGRVLTGPGFIAVEERMAATLGLTGRSGERVVLTSFYDKDKVVEYELAAIYRLPHPTSISTPVITLMHPHSLPLFPEQRGRQYPAVGRHDSPVGETSGRSRYGGVQCEASGIRGGTDRV